MRSCSVPVAAAAGKDIITIEGLAGADGKLHPVQAAWVAEDVPQCGYCQSGQIMAAAALLEGQAEPHRRRHQRHHQYLPLRHLCAHPQGHSPRRDDEDVIADLIAFRRNSKLGRRSWDLSKPNLSRRQFVVAEPLRRRRSDAGRELSERWPPRCRCRQRRGATTRVAANEINAWIVIDPDETITIRIPHAEMGQGAGTANPMLVAEELECDWAKIKGEFASPNRNVRENNVYKDQNTVGSRGVATSWQYLQQAGASARARLVQAAANQWKVPASECVAENGAVLHKASNRSLTYGKLAADAAKITLDKEPEIKKPGEFKLLGKPLPRLDTPVKVERPREVRHRYEGRRHGLCRDHRRARSSAARSSASMRADSRASAASSRS